MTKKELIEALDPFEDGEDIVCDVDSGGGGWGYGAIEEVKIIAGKAVIVFGDGCPFDSELE